MDRNLEVHTISGRSTALRRLATMAVAMLILATGVTAFGQTPSPTASPTGEASPSEQMGRQGMGIGGGRGQADGCDRMCKGMGGHRAMGVLGMVLGGTLGVLLLVALGLFVALEIVWLRHWLLRLRRERAATA